MVNDVDKKETQICIRISDTQKNILKKIKANNIRLTNTDMLMSGMNLLNYLFSITKKDDFSYKELINALIIRDDLLRCLDKTQNKKGKSRDELQKSLKENEIKINNFLKILLN